MKFAIISFAVLLRVLVGFQPHSGQDDYQGSTVAERRSLSQKVKYGGDYEAQRHWMEITYHLPLSEWYWHDLEYWGLDYPPLTAYVSWACGWLAHNLGSLSSDPLGNSGDYDDNNDDHSITAAYECQSSDDECLQTHPTSEEEQDHSNYNQQKQQQQQHGGLRVIKDLVALHSSRFGYEEPLGKMYMRFTVLFLDLIVYMSAVLTITKRLSSDVKSGDQGEPPAKSSITSIQKQQWLLITALIQPAIILIDHGHFQYNTTSLGLALWSFHFMTQTSFIGPVVGSFLFSLALNFKQMELYHAPAVFAYLLGRCFCNDDHHKKHQRSMALRFAGKFCALGISVLFTFAVLWLPFAFYSRESSSTTFDLAGIVQVLKRLFPFQRGLFEGKVSNIWCALSIKPIYLRSRIRSDLLPILATGLTLAMILPSCFLLFLFGRENKHTSKKNLEFLLWGSVSTSLAFFLASYQVHEKGILIALAPLSLLLLDSTVFVIWFSIVATWSLWPLLVIDRLCEAYVCCIIIFLCVNAMMRPVQISVTRGNYAFYAAGLSSVAMMLLHVVEWGFKPPSHLPDLFAVLWSLLGCGLFCISYLITIWAMVSKAKDGGISRPMPQQTNNIGKGSRNFFSVFLGLLALTPGESFSYHRGLRVCRHHARSFSMSLYAGKSDDFRVEDLVLTTDLLERAREPLLWEQQEKKDSEPVLNLSARNSDVLPLADGFSEGADAMSDENHHFTWEDGKQWSVTERELSTVGIVLDVTRAPQLLRLPTEQVIASAHFFLGNCTDESLESLLQVDPSLLTYKKCQLQHGIEYLCCMMTRGNRTAAIQMIQTQFDLSPSMGIQLLKLGVDGGIEESRIAQLLGSAGQSSGKAVKGVVGDMRKDIREWKKVKGGKNSLGG